MPDVGARTYWGAAVEYVDHGVSGSQDHRPALDRLVKNARRRKFGVLVTWKLTAWVAI